MKKHWQKSNDPSWKVSVLSCEGVGDLPEFTSVSDWMHLEETVGVQSLVPLRTVTASEESA